MFSGNGFAHHKAAKGTKRKKAGGWEVEISGGFMPPGGLSGLQPEPLNLLNTEACAIDKISKGINIGVQVTNLNPQRCMFPVANRSWLLPKTLGFLYDSIKLNGKEG